MLKKLTALILLTFVFTSGTALENIMSDPDEDGSVVAAQPLNNKASEANAITDPAKPIVVRSVSPAFSINLSGNITTGYQWYLTDYNPRLVKLLGQQYVKSQTKQMGAPGVSVWQFQLQQIAFSAPQVTRITFEYRRSWELKAIKKETFTIVSEPNASNVSIESPSTTQQ